MTNLLKKILIISLPLILTNCGPKVDIISAPRNIHSLDNQPEGRNTTSGTSVKNEISDSLRDITFIIKPNSSELDNYELDYSKLTEEESGCDLFLSNKAVTLKELPALLLIKNKLFSLINKDGAVEHLLLETSIDDDDSTIRDLNFKASKFTYLKKSQCEYIHRTGGHLHNKTYGAWSKTFLNNTNYASKIPKVINRNLDNEKKLEDLTYLIYAAGDIKTKKNEEKIRLEKSDLNPASKINDLKKERKSIFKLFPCYKVKIKQEESGDKKVRTCLLAPSDDQRRPKIERTKNCKHFSKRLKSKGKHYRYYNLDEDTIEQYKLAVESCEEVEDKIKAIKDELTPIYQKALEPIESVIESSSKVVTDLLELLKTDDGIDFAVGKDVGASVLSVNKELTKINELTLVLSSFTSLRGGDIEYSTLNGKIQNAHFSTRYGIKMLNFTIVEEDVRAAASLSFSEHPILGVSFTGDINLTYSNGIKRKGIMKLELDYKSEKN